MKKIRILAAVLAVLMLPLALLFSCGTTEQVGCTNGEHEFPRKWETVQKRSCVLDEIEQATCKVCGFVKQQVANKATGHVFDPANKVSMNDATCTEDGQYIIECTWCTATQTEPYPGSKLGHKFANYEVIEGDEYIEKAFCINCNAGTDTRILGINLDMEGERDHLTYKTMEIFTGTNGTSEYKSGVNGSTALNIKRPQGDVIGSSAYGIILSPRTDILEGKQYVIEFEIVLSGATGNVTLTGTKAVGGQKMDFVTYNKENNSIDVSKGPAYAIQSGDLDKLKIAVVTNDTKNMYDLYVNNVLVAASVGYIDDFYSGFGIGTFDIRMAEGNTASEISIDNVKLYNGTQPEGYNGETLEVYDYYTTKTGEVIITFTLDADCDHNFEYKKVTTNCSASSYILKECTICKGGAVTQEFAPVEHKFKYSHTTAATCWTPGFECNVCTVCGERDGRQVEAQLQHQLGTDAKTYEPDCITPGYTIGNCVRCGYEWQDPSKNVPVLGHTINLESPNTKTEVATCTKDGYTEGPCVRCEKVIKPDNLKVPALGHTCFNPVVIEATCSEPGYTQNKCDACNTEYKTNQVGTLAHTEFSRVNEGAIETMCVICKASTKLPLVEVMPTSDQQLEYIKSIEGGCLFLNASLDDGSIKSYGTTNSTSNGLNSTKIGAGSTGRLQLVCRYSTWTLRNAAVGKYWEVQYWPQNCTNSDSVHSYLNVYCDNYTKYKGKTFIFEISIRPNAAGTFPAMNVEGIERFTSSPYGVQTWKVTEDGTMYAGSSRYNGGTWSVIGKLDTTDPKKWTRVAIAFDTTERAAKTYVDGILVATCPLDSTKSTSFPYVQEFRLTVGTQDKKRTEPQAIDVDEIYSYIADQPLYITGLNRYDTAATNIADAVNDEGQSYLSKLGSANLGYTGAETWSAVTEDGKNVVKYVKNGTGVDLPGNLDGNTSGIEVADTKMGVGWTTVDVKFPAVDDVVIDVIRGDRTYRTEVLPDEPEVPDEGEGEGDVEGDGEGDGEGEEVPPAPVYKYDVTTNKYVYLDDGVLYDGNGKAICKIEAGKWYNISLITKELSGVVTYEIYVNGIYYHTNTAVFATGDYTGTITNETTGVVTAQYGPKVVFLAGQTNCEYFVSDIAVYGNVSVPDIYEGRLENDIEIPGDETVIFQATENYDVNTLVKVHNNSKGNLTSNVVNVPATEEGAEDTSYLELRPATRETIYAGYEVAKVGLNRKVGEEAGTAEGLYKWTVKASNFATNCGATGKYDIFRFDTLNGVPASADGTYDLTGYEKIRIRLFVGETDGYSVLFYIHTGVDEATGKDKFCYKYFTTQNGWMTLEFDLATLGDDNKNATLNSVDYISFYVSGWAKAGNNGNPKDGTSIYMESITLIANPQVCPDTGYLQSETACKEGHTFDAGVTVAPTCDSKGYTVKTCTVENCGVKEVTDVVPAKGHTNNAGEVVVDKAATCEKNGVKTTKFTCSTCNAETYTNVVTVAAGHKVTGETIGEPNTCTTAGYKIVTCTNANCDYAEDVTEIRYVLEATGHKPGATTTVINATCEAAGGTQTTCTECSTAYIIEGTEVPALGHSMIDKAGSRVEPGCETEGSITKVCANNCGKEETTTIKATGHDMVETNRVPAANGVPGTITYTCANGCGATETASITAFPSVETMNTLGDKIIASITGEGIAAGSFKGDGSKNGINAAYAKWMTGTDATGSYLNVYAVPENGTVVSNYKVAATGTTVLEFNVRANLDIFAGFKVKATIDGSEQTVLGVANTGKITFSGKVEQFTTVDISETQAWTRIAVVFDTVAGTVDFWFNGTYYRSQFFTKGYALSDVSISVGEDATGGCGISLDDIYVFTGTEPVFQSGIIHDDHMIEMDAKYFNTPQGYLKPGKGNTWADGLFKKTNLVYKLNYAMTLNEMTSTFYGDEAESTKNVLKMEKNPNVPSYSTVTGTAADSYIDIGDFILDYNPVTIHMSMTLKVDKIGNTITLWNGRRSGTATGWANAYLKYTKNGDIQFLNSTVAKVNNGEWVKLDLYLYNQGTYECALFVNDEFVAYNDGSHSVITQQFKDNTKDCVYRSLNVNASAEYELYISDWDVKVNVKFPEIPEA